MKRGVDILVSLSALIVFAPVIAVLCIAVRCDSAGCPIYSQERLGQHKRRFMMYKLRTMVDDAEQGVPMLTVPDDRRITGIGRWMRKFRVDELPQLWNVLRGDMSLVGPRPEREYYFNLIENEEPSCRRVLDVKPGLTSLGIIRHGYASDVDGMVLRLKYDLEYLDKCSLSTDMRILLATILTVIKGKGI